MNSIDHAEIESKESNEKQNKKGNKQRNEKETDEIIKRIKIYYYYKSDKGEIYNEYMKKLYTIIPPIQNVEVQEL